MAVYARSFAPFQYRHLAILQTAKYSEPEASYPIKPKLLFIETVYMEI